MVNETKQALQQRWKIIKAAINAENEIQKCTYCQPLQKEIEQHHPTIKSTANAILTIGKCKACRAKITMIIACAKNGHQAIAESV